MRDALRRLARAFSLAFAIVALVISAPPIGAFAQAVSGAPADAWKLLRSRDPAGGPDAISIVRTAEPSRSDPDIAGLMLRCSASRIETLVVVIEPSSPRARLRVTLGAKGASTALEATAVPPFTALLLPPEATSMLSGPWLSAPELSIEISGDRKPANAVVLLAGLGQALERLTAGCRSR
jgi:hypothetical protein